MTARSRRPGIRHPGTRRLLGPLSLLALVLAIAWCCGFAWFAYTATRPAPPVPEADGIVVLTGGAGRIEAALDLLQQNRAQLMLISGVSEYLSLQQIAHAAGRTLAPGLSDRIALGHSATSTVGNAIETASWARANGLHSLIVVTAGYHMRRALAEIGTALPDTTLYPDPVQPPALVRAGLGRWRLGTLRLLAEEYTKWLAVEVGLTGSAHLRETA
ncbi:YdcF family protein [Lichenicola cladoniae]|uniref:YdcF family protein n=1 Tax=Lichenicola cladoniae TaxID=1484109 RepID=A0A6M8HN08_9PROT|nr:YdcF family protein [Lichenicola cladoniae]NPD67154.1 YdcF family protein [Acetobacteraceae bacterium]QKE89681.1 YdcF family protein [Lichenicola cladoniae]